LANNRAIAQNLILYCEFLATGVDARMSAL
jgi:hypothetical protein